MPAKKSFPARASRAGKAQRGATPLDTTPLEIRTRVALPAAVAADLRARLTRALGRAATLIDRIVVRFTDVNGPKGGIDTDASIEVVLSGLPPVVVTDRGRGPAAAFRKVIGPVERAVRRSLERHDRTAGRTRGPRAASSTPLAGAPSMIGRREGRSPLKLAMVQVRPEKHRRDLWTDTAQPGVSESDRQAGAGHSARRNTRARRSDQTVTLEDSLGRPSRKSTRRSANRGKPSQGKERTAQARAVTPSARRRTRS